MSATSKKFCAVWCAPWALMLVLAVAPGELRAQQGGGPPPPPAPGETAGHYYKSVHVLKDLPANQLVPAMQVIAYSLNVRCTYCHDPEGFERESTKPAYAAGRQMIAMVLDLNQKNFHGETKVSCYTCHSGALVPAISPLALQPGKVFTPPLAAPPGERRPGMQPAAEAPPSADQLIAKYEKAIDGAEAIRTFKTRFGKGTMDTGSSVSEFEQWYEAPNKTYINRLGPPSTKEPRAALLRQGYDGKTPWAIFTAEINGVMREIPGVTGVTLKRPLDFAPALDLKQSYKGFHDVSKTKVETHDAYLVLADTADGSGTDQLYFDAASGLLLRSVQSTPTFFGDVLTQFDYGDYRAAGGVKVPFEVRMAMPDGATVFRYTAIQFNVAVDESKFSKPAPASRPPAPEGRP